jgi:hypothetical protein
MISTSEKPLGQTDRSTILVVEDEILRSDGVMSRSMHAVTVATERGGCQTFGVTYEIGRPTLEIYLRC